MKPVRSSNAAHAAGQGPLFAAQGTRGAWDGLKVQRHIAGVASVIALANAGGTLLDGNARPSLLLT